MSPSDISPLLDALHALLTGHPRGLREYELIRRLREAAVPGFPTGPLSDPVVLFGSHFLLRHALYQLRDRCLEEGAGLVEMDALEIRLAPYRSGADATALYDPLRRYYEDLTHLETTDADAVERLLADFWQRLAANERRQSALAVLDLADPVDRGAITRRYRRLAQRHHPDRGGDSRRFHAIRKAYETLI